MKENGKMLGLPKNVDISGCIRSHMANLSDMVERGRALEAENAAAPFRQREAHHQEILRKHEEILAMERELLAESRKDRWKVALIAGIISAIIGAIVGALMA